MRIFYLVFVYFYFLGIKIASNFNIKAKKWINGRKGLFNQLSLSFPLPDKLAWFHVASLGEFEQGRPVIESFKKKFPEYKIVLTFFSPSGYEVRSNYELADFVYYLPLDTRKNARKFIEMIQPDVVFFVKYEYWFNYIDILYKKEIPIYLIAAIFRPSQYFFKWYASWFRKQLQKVSHYFVQNETSEKLLESIEIDAVTITGDTRFDRVLAVVSQHQPIPLIEQYKAESKLFVVGSSWEKDEELIISLINRKPEGIKFIIAPHEVNSSRINALMEKLPKNAMKYSEIDCNNSIDGNVLVIDTIGILMHIYQYADLAYIGGGFGAGIHNILEPAAFGVPVMFGPKYHKFSEAKELLKERGAFCINTADGLIQRTDDLFESNTEKDICLNYIKKKAGATEKIITIISETIRQKM